MTQQPACAQIPMTYTHQETKNSYRYSPVNDRNPVGDVYVKKSLFPQGIAAAKILVTVTTAPE